MFLYDTYKLIFYLGASSPVHHMFDTYKEFPTRFKPGQRLWADIGGYYGFVMVAAMVIFSF